MDEVTPGGPEDRLLVWGRVREIVGLSRTTAWRLQQRDEFPKPVHLSPGRVGWWESELNSWKRARSSAAPPIPLRRLPMRIRVADPPAQSRETAEPSPAAKPVSHARTTARRPNAKVCQGQADFGF